MAGRPASVRPRTIADVGEFGLIEIIKSIVQSRDPALALGIGDDAAAFRPTPGLLTLATCDIQVEGRHFLRERTTAYQLGRRSAAVNLSDMAAMGGQPRHALVSLALDQELPVQWVEDLYRGLKEEFARFGAAVIGGNLSSTTGQLVIDITLLGEIAEAQMVKRSGGHAGDAVLVTGSLGASAAGLQALGRGLDVHRLDIAAVIKAHLEPSPRVREGQAIARTAMATAMIDISDGLAADLGHICEASHTGARIHADKLPVSAETRAVAALLGADPLDLALSGGEDYELIFTCRPENAARLIETISKETGAQATVVGELTQSPGVVLARPGKRDQPVAKGGWDHFRG